MYKRQSLYIRPFTFGTDETLGVHAVEHAAFCVILSPVGSYYKEGINPVGIMIEDQDVRAVRGGTGYAKCGGNYAASNRAGERAEQKGYSQVLWLDGVERKYIEEVGAMNVKMCIRDSNHDFRHVHLVHHVPHFGNGAGRTGHDARAHAGKIRLFKVRMLQ